MAIIHLATYYKKHHTPDDVDPMIKSNILFPVELLEKATKFDVKTFINTGTFFEYPTIHFLLMKILMKNHLIFMQSLN